jgi:hypothetical protein
MLAIFGDKVLEIGGSELLGWGAISALVCWQGRDKLVASQGMTCDSPTSCREQQHC